MVWVSDEAVRRVDVAALPYCCKSSRKRLLLTNTVMVLQTQLWARSLLAQLAAKEATDDLRSAISLIMLPKLRLVQIVCRRSTSLVSMHGTPLSSNQV